MTKPLTIITNTAAIYLGLVAGTLILQADYIDYVQVLVVSLACLALCHVLAN